MGKHDNETVVLSLDFRFTTTKHAMQELTRVKIHTSESLAPLLEQITLNIPDPSFDASIRAILVQHCTSFVSQELVQLIEAIQKAAPDHSTSDLLALLNTQFQKFTTDRTQHFNRSLNANSPLNLLLNLIHQHTDSTAESLLYRLAPLYHVNNYDLAAIARLMNNIIALIQVCEKILNKRQNSPEYLSQLLTVKQILVNRLIEIQYIHAALTTNTHCFGQSQREKNRSFIAASIALEKKNDAAISDKSFNATIFSESDITTLTLFFEASLATSASHDLLEGLTDNAIELQDSGILEQFVMQLRRIGFVLREKKNPCCLEYLHQEWVKRQNPETLAALWERLLLLEKLLQEKNFRDTLETVGYLKLLLLEARWHRIDHTLTGHDEATALKRAQMKQYLATAQKLYSELMRHQTTDPNERQYGKNLMTVLPTITSAAVLNTSLAEDTFAQCVQLLEQLAKYPILQQKIGGLFLTFVGLSIVLGSLLLVGLAASSVIALPAALSAASGLLLGLDLAAIGMGGTTAALGGLLFSCKPKPHPESSLPAMAENTLSHLKTVASA